MLFNPHSHIGAARADIDPKGGDAVGQELRLVGFLEEKQIALLHVSQMVERGFDLAHHHAHIEFGVTNGNRQVFAPNFVGLLVAIAGGYAVAQLVAQRLQSGVGVDQIHETFAARCGRFSVKACQHHQIVFVGNLRKLWVDLGADLFAVDF